MCTLEVNKNEATLAHTQMLNAIVWMENMDPIFLPVRACWESLGVFAHVPRVSWEDNTYPLLHRQDVREEKEATADSQWAKWASGSQGARQTKVAAAPTPMHQTDELTATIHFWQIQRAAFQEGN